MEISITSSVAQKLFSSLAEMQKLKTQFKKLQKREDGVTLLELLVSVSMFAAVVSIVVAIFISMAFAQKRSASAVDIDSATYFALESMAKEIRTGSDFVFPTNSDVGLTLDCSWGSINSSCSALKFINYRNQIVIYRLNDPLAHSPIEKMCVEDADLDGVIDNGELYCYTSTQVTGRPYTFNPITPSTMRVADLKFNLDGHNPTGAPDKKQSRVIIILKGETPTATPTVSKRDIILQTVISARGPDS